MKLSSRETLLNEADNILKQIHEEYFDAEDVLATTGEKGQTVEYFRISMISPMGKQVYTGWLPFKEKTLQKLKQELQREQYKIVKIERKMEKL